MTKRPSPTDDKIEPPLTLQRISHLFNTVLARGYDDPTSYLSDLCENVLRYEIEPYLCGRINPSKISGKLEKLKTPLNIKALNLIGIRASGEHGVLYGHSDRAIFVARQDNMIEEIEFIRSIKGEQIFGVTMLPNGEFLYISKGDDRTVLCLYDCNTRMWSILPTTFSDWVEECYCICITPIGYPRIIVLINGIVYWVDLHTYKIDMLIFHGECDLDPFGNLPDHVNETIFIHYNKLMQEIVVVVGSVKKIHFIRNYYAFAVLIYDSSIDLISTTVCGDNIGPFVKPLCSVDADNTVVLSYNRHDIMVTRSGTISCSVHEKPISGMLRSTTIDSRGRLLRLTDNVIYEQK
jgi:hypothetical protein